MTASENFSKLSSPRSKTPKRLIILRGFPGSGKSTLASALVSYLGIENNIICSYDKYHNWVTDANGNKVFKFNYSIHYQTKDWCNEEVFQSIKDEIPVIIVDNGNFEKYEYDKFQSLASSMDYQSTIIEIKSETNSMKRAEHLNHIRCRSSNSCDMHSFHDNCYLCHMQFRRCKMQIPNKVIQRCINKYEVDTNAIMIDPKFNDEWNDIQLETLLNVKQKRIRNELQSKSSEDDKKQSSQGIKTDQILDMTLDEFANYSRNKYRNEDERSNFRNRNVRNTNRSSNRNTFRNSQYTGSRNTYRKQNYNKY